MQYPNTVKVKQINSKHSEYDGEKIKIYTALYEGGSTMTDEIKSKIIIRRQNEIKFQREVYNLRLQKSYYTNRAGGVIDYIVSNATADAPRIVVSEKANDEQKEFWLRKNINSDGQGTPFPSVFRQLLKDELVTKRPLLKVDIVDDEINISRLNPEMMIDWGVSEGEQWIKTYAINYLKESPFSKDELIENIWTIYTQTDTIVYRCISKKDGDNWLYRDEDSGDFGGDESAVAILSNEDSVFDHDFQALPIFSAKPNWWLMDRISESVKNLYNSESDLTWVLGAAAYPQGILKLESEGRFQKVYNKSESAIWNLLPEESYEIISSSGIDFEALFKNVDRLKLSLLESMQMMAAEASTIPQAGRLSGEAVKEMRSPLDALLQSFLWPILDQCYDMIEAVKLYRNEEDLGVWIEGLNVSTDELALRKLLLGEEVEPVVVVEEPKTEEEVEEEVEE